MSNQLQGIHFDSMIAELSQEGFRMEIRGVVRGFWTGIYDADEAYQRMYDTLVAGFDAAWTEGAASVGIREDERTSNETRRLNEITSHHISFLDGFLASIEMETKELGGKLGPHMVRAELWSNRYNEVVMRARIISGQDKKLRWRLGATEVHCSSCLKLDGKVKRGSSWAAARIWPQHPDLECKGFLCDCTLDPTKAPMSKGRLPRIP